MEKRKIDPSRWYEQDGKLRISLMRYFVEIDESEYDTNLYIYYDCKVVLTLKFINTEQAMAFTEDVINNVYSIEDIMDGYKEYIKGSEWINNVYERYSKLERLETSINDLIELNNCLKKEYSEALKKHEKKLKSENFDIDENNNFDIYLNYLAEQYNKLMNIESNLINELGEKHINNHLNVSDKTRKKFIKNSKNKPNN